MNFHMISRAPVDRRTAGARGKCGSKDEGRAGEESLEERRERRTWKGLARGWKTAMVYTRGSIVR